MAEALGDSPGGVGEQATGLLRMGEPGPRRSGDEVPGLVGIAEAPLIGLRRPVVVSVGGSLRSHRAAARQRRVRSSIRRSQLRMIASSKSFLCASVDIIPKVFVAFGGGHAGGVHKCKN